MSLNMKAGLTGLFVCLKVIYLQQMKISSASLLYFYVYLDIQLQMYIMYVYIYVRTWLFQIQNLIFFLVLEKTGLSARSKHPSINLLYFSSFYYSCSLYATSLWLEKKKYGDFFILNIYPKSALSTVCLLKKKKRYCLCLLKIQKSTVLFSINSLGLHPSSIIGCIIC